MNPDGAPEPNPLTLEEENLRLRRALEELSLLNDLAREIGGSRTTQEMMDTLVKRSLRAIQAEQGVLTLVQSHPEEPMKTFVRKMDSSGKHLPIHLNELLQGWMFLNKKPLLMNDPRNDPRFKGVKWDDSTSSLICVPLLVKSNLTGVLTVFNKKEAKGFTEDDVRLLAIIAAQSAQVLENARLYEEQQELVIIQKDIKVASTIQTNLLPKEAPDIPGYEIAGKSIPAREVGGDYFDFIPLEDKKLAFCLGDVSGKGLAAAMLMSNLQATIRGESSIHRPPKECLERANRSLLQNTDADRFVTLFYALLDYEDHLLCYCNAGHERPFVRSGNEQLQRLSEGGIVLSVVDEPGYQEDLVSVEPGDLFVIYSDGVIDATDESEFPFGEKRLAELIEDSEESSAAEVIDKIVDAVQVYSGGKKQTDDITLVVLRRNPA